MPTNTPITRILELARWAPSGDNTQPWRFEIIDDEHFLIHTNDTRDWCVYDLDGHASQTAVGALLENIELAATAESMAVTIKRRKSKDEEHIVFAVALKVDVKIKPHPLVPFITERVTQRRPFATTSLTIEQKQALEAAVGEDHRVLWLEANEQKRKFAVLLFKFAFIPFSIPETFKLHKRIIHWNTKFSEDRVPDQAIGLDSVSLKSMKWALHSLERVDMLNRYFAGTWIPRIQLNLIPGLRCGAHFAIVANSDLESSDQYHQGGRALQRFWLTAASLGLLLQPEMTPLIFSRYVATSENFTEHKKAIAVADQQSQELKKFFSDTELKRVFMGRIGTSVMPFARSTRLAISQLLIKK